MQHRNRFIAANEDQASERLHLIAPLAVAYALSEWSFVRARAWDFTVGQFWCGAARVAHKRGYSGVFAEGRSGGWCVPYHWSKPGIKHTCNGSYSQGPGVGYPVYPDVAHDSAERERFRAFEREIRRLLDNVQEEFTANLEQAKESA